MANVLTNNVYAKRTLNDFLRNDQYEDFLAKVKFDILSDPRLHTLHQLIELNEKIDARLGRVERMLIEQMASQEARK